ncbi:MAG: hypothetical protein HY420_02955 [Candidatus Kerfeldbacteria bacterium]|nr:hypothetical protein [Candidatus Kerfeldbacteria bacterium]
MEQISLKKTRAGARLWGNEHLVTIVIVLTSMLGALSIFTIWYKNRPVNVQATRSSVAAQNTTTRITTDAPAGRHSFVGIIKEINDNRLAVRLFQNVNGNAREQIILVNMLQNTEVATIGKAPVSLDANAARPRTAATFSDIKVGGSVDVHSIDVIDGQTSVVADRIDILTN